MLNGAVWLALFMATIVHVGQFLICEADESGGAPSATSTNPFTALNNIIFFGGCDGINGLGQFLLFAFFTLPILMVIAGYVFMMFGSEIGAVFAGILAIGTAAIAIFS